MRRFVFRLETVLRYRETIEALCEQEFMTAQGVVMALEARVRKLQLEYRLAIAARPGSVSGERLDAPLIVDCERYVATLLAALGPLEREIESARIVTAEKRIALVEAKQAREAVSNLRDREAAEHAALSVKQEQDVLDEAATLRHFRAHRPLVRPGAGGTPASTPPTEAQEAA